ncbi:alpha/beta fold hydrolase [Streptomyces sp. NPDC050610]|uniref:thioesterase II family protein n=1 Tax=Streptomyces sp. NPDC050610 TaxID=3157097 RepID=UPI00342ECD06
MSEAPRAGRPLLTDLTEAAGLTAAPEAATVVCLPYAGGGAFGYVPFARALHEAGKPLRVLAADLPGRDRDDGRPAVPADRLTADLAQEIAMAVPSDTDVVLLGHSSGTGPALTAGMALRAMGRPPARFVAVAALPPAPGPDGHPARAAAALTDAELFARFAAEAETVPHADADRPGTDQLPPEERADIARAFRYDVLTALDCFASARHEAGRNGAAALGCPVTVLLAADDRSVADRRRDTRQWAVFGTALHVEWTAEGGHYLNTSRPRFLASGIPYEYPEHPERPECPDAVPRPEEPGHAPYDGP